MSTTYPSNLSDAEWKSLQRYLPPASRRGRPPTHSLRSIARRDLLRAAHRLPVALLASQFSAMANRLLSRIARLHDPRDLDALAASTAPGRTRTARKEPASKSRHHGRGIRVKTVEESAGICGFDAHKHVKGRKRQRYG